jgi:broad specificity phosphatase PhoE
MKLYFVRHGQTNSNAQAINQPATDSNKPLNEVGSQQVNSLAEELKIVDFDIVITSPFKRAVQTAAIINKNHGLPVNIENSFREIETNGYVDLNTWNDLFNFGKSTSTKNIEPLRHFFKRIYKTLDQLVAKYEDKTILVVSHGGVQHALYAYANKLPLTGKIRISPMKNCEYRIYQLHQ